MNKKKIFLISFLFFFLKPIELNASCNFKTGEYIDKLKKPKEIKEILISIPDSKKYVLNSLKILLSRGETINPKLRKRYNADIQVQYSFGICNYKAKVWQNGDFKDHIKWNDATSSPLTSLNVKFKEGNLLNAVKFKLLIPETRNNLNEILGTIVARKLGFISPETFETQVSINGNKTVMIFQEDSRKELLERNQRREGPIFEGDESIIWGNYNNRKDFEFEELSLARLINWKWFLKGKSSQIITLNAFKNLQYSYLPEQQLKGNVINPNFRTNNNFQDYYFLMAIMNGQHALRPHNRKYYFNALENSFEPIYYDGDLILKNKIDFNHEFFNFENAFIGDYYFPYLIELDNINFKKKVIDEFESRIIEFNKDKYHFANNSLSSIYKNGKKLNKYLSIMGKKDNKINDFNKSIVKYNTIMKSKNLDQKIINSYKIIKENIIIKIDNNNEETLSLKDFGKLISRSKHNNERYIFLPKRDEEDKENFLKKIFLQELEGEIILSPGMNFDLDKNKRIIKIKQTNSQDWILFKDLKLNKWNIYFEGIKSQSNNKKINSQRFNNYGITGCLNFLNANFSGSSITINKGECEDSINIINSKGDIDSIIVEDSFQDAIDLDFSRLRINSLIVKNAGNDCFDVSGGKYILNTGSLKNCGDKGLSVGESSELTSNNVFIHSSLIGISVKDLSIANLHDLKISKNEICIESKQKKQEFGGGYVFVKSLRCEKPIINLDKHSIIEIENHEL